MKVDIDKSKIQSEVPTGYPLGSIILTDRTAYQVLCIGTDKRTTTPFDYLLMDMTHGYLLRHSSTHDYVYLTRYIENNLNEKIIGFVKGSDLKVI